MNRYQKQVELELLDHEEYTDEKLKKLYEEALTDAKKKLSDWQHDKNTKRIRHVKHQEILIAQLESILGRLRKEIVHGVDEYLRKMYEDAYLGNLFTMHRDGVELMLRPDEDQIRRVVEKKTGELKFSDRIYRNTEKLKEDWRREMSRGLASGRDYKSIAVQLALYGDASLKRAYTIVRTEGHRVQSESRMDCMRDAVAKGAAVVKQWDSTVDSRTRGTHRDLDGQIKELEEPFIIPSSGRKAMYPGGFGVPAEDINCRCTLLQRARWALDGEEQKYSKLAKGIISRDSDTYDKWKGEYQEYQDLSWVKELIKAAEEIAASERIPLHFQELPQEHLDAIRGLLQQGDEAAVRCFLKYQDELVFKSVKTPYKSHFYSKKGIFINLDEAAVDCRGAYTPVLHEIGHCIDFQMGQVSGSKEFLNQLREDEKEIEKQFREFYNITDRNQMNEKLSEVLSESNKYHFVSDIYSGITGERYGKFGHAPEYWNERKITAEAFAHFFANALSGDSEKIEIMRTFFPKAYEAFRIMIEER